MPSTTRPYRGLGAEERRAARRAALLEAALDLAGGDGTPALTMTAVCRRAGLTERYFYESFRDRDALLVELLDAIAAEVMAAVGAALGAGGPGPEARVREAVRALVGVLLGDPRKGRLALVESMTVPALRLRRQELLTGFAQVTAEHARELYGDRAWDAPDSAMESLLFVGGLAELLSAALTGRLEAEPDLLVDAVARHFNTTAHR